MIRTPSLPLPTRKPDNPPVKREKPMTIVAGFHCKDGIVLAADTLVSNYQSKSYESKIFSIGNAKFSCYMAYSGVVSVVKDIRDDLRQIVAETDEERQLIPR
jgi:20S proteasome alpha/beta subunit